MKKRLPVLLAAVVVLGAAALLTACLKAEAKNVQEIPAWLSDFNLPEGFAAENVTDGGCGLVYDGQTVGGIVLTGLDADVLSDPHSGGEEIVAYLKSDAVQQIHSSEFAYLMGWGSGTPLQVSLWVAGTDAEYAHYLFQTDSVCCDLWLDRSRIDSEAEDRLLVSAGLQEKSAYAGYAR